MTPEQAALLKEMTRRERRHKLARYKPYEKQREFHAAGATYRERLLMAANQVGKTFAGGAELAMHVTGEYPDWWHGKRFNHPILAWTGSETNETSKEIIQKILLGTSEPEMTGPDMGTGSIPGDLIVKVTTRQAGVKGVVDEILVKHVSGSNSRISLKTYEQGRAKWQSASVHVIWLDEEPDDAMLYTEALTRTNATNGCVLMTFTPLKGTTEVVELFLDPSPGDAPRHVTSMTIYDAEHYTPEDRAKIISSYPEHEREARAMGVPIMGEGLVWAVSDDAIRCDPFPIPAHFSRIAGIDFGVDHPTAGAWLAHDRDTDTIYLYDVYSRTDTGYAEHALAFKARDPNNFIPVAWPHDGLKRDNKDPKSGERLKDAYRKAGVRMMRESARYDNETGGSQPVEPVVQEIYERMQTGRFKAFSTCQKFFDEKRTYHRKNGVIVDYKDDVISAVRMAVMQLRSAKTYIPSRPRQTFNGPIAA